MTTTTCATPAWRRPAALAVGLLTAVAVAVTGAGVLALPAWAAAAVGVTVAQAVATGLEMWDDRHFPDLVMTFEAGLK